MDDNVVLPGRGVLAEVDVSGLIANGQGSVFEYTDRLGQRSQGFVMFWQGEYRAYENRCPHWSMPLGLDDHFIDRTGQIFCPIHGALFDIDSGECTIGPCVGSGIERFDVEVVDSKSVRVRRTAIKPKIEI